MRKPYRAIVSWSAERGSDGAALEQQQAIRWGTFGSLRLLTDTINAYIENWNQDAEPFTWTATPKEIIAKVRIIHRDFKKLLANNSK
jgi:hypothetical protein